MIRFFRREIWCGTSLYLLVKTAKVWWDTNVMYQQDTDIVSKAENLIIKRRLRLKGQKGSGPRLRFAFKPWDNPATITETFIMLVL